MERTKDNIEKLINQGKSIREISKIFGITPTPMRMQIKKFGLQVKHNNRTWTDNDLILAVESSFTVSQVLRKLNLQVRPGSFVTIQKYIKKLNLSTDHFTGKAHGTSDNKKYQTHEIFIENSNVLRRDIKRRIIKDNLIEYKCEVCKMKPIWQNKKLVLILDHINGINNDNRLENLRFLCPNCNSQQKTFCRGSK